uniref:Phorbol-ester/DAG-type domain-containing protein n=1 Tax=Brassica oleracea var. oleracea TaxID=109376 RepID=A0A0D3CXG2_BRAOL
MDASSTKLPIHEHPLFSSARFHSRCQGCGKWGDYYGGYLCNDSECGRIVMFHKECAESPLEINHPSHPEHPLILTETPPRFKCDLCGKYLFVQCFPYFYHCSICDFNVDTSCARKPPLPLHHPDPQEPPFVLIKENQSQERCRVCEQSVCGKYHYGRPSCDEYVHLECVDVAEKVKHLPFHPDHPLDMCLGCVITPPPLVIEHPKTHEHQLTLSTRQISFTCNVCGVPDNRSSYSCLPCGFTVHRSCIDMPQVIIINRHNHRLAYTNHLGPGFSDCGVCRRPVDQLHGAYSCSICPTYAVHSKCATTIKVWDGINLEGVPEEIEELPFKVVGDDNMKINHFSHEEHNLRLTSENVITDETTLCAACVYPLSDSGPIYSCVECDYFLHEKCANLPMKIRHVSYNGQFVLHARGGEGPEVQFLNHLSMKAIYIPYIMSTKQASPHVTHVKISCAQV